MAKFKLQKQFPKAKNVGQGVLSLDQDSAFFFDGDGGAGSEILGEIRTPKIVSAAKDGLMIEGFEPKIKKNGDQSFIFQQWWLIYL
jgi:hypothetical protein